MPAIPFPRQAYYERIGAAKSLLPLFASCGRMAAATSPTANMQFLKQMMLSHTSAIPFETLDVLLGRRVSLAPADVYAKLIHARRGGYCYEQNVLFYEALRDAGFTDVRPVAAHLLLAGEDTPLGRTHMLNIVTLPAEDGAAPQQWLVDVGFGLCVTLAPLLLNTTEPQQTVTGVVRLRTRDACAEVTGGWTEYVLEVQMGETWRPVYNFDLQPQKPRDFYMMNYVVSRESLFRWSVHAARADGVWVAVVAEHAKKDTTDATVSETEYVYVPRGSHSAVVDAGCKIAARRAAVEVDERLAGLPEVGGVLSNAQSHFSTPAELYDWFVHTLKVDLAQTRVPQHTVTREEFEKVARERLVVFGGTAYTPSHRL